MLDATEIREKLVGARKSLDDAAKEIVEDARKKDEATETRIMDAEAKAKSEFTEKIVTPADRCQAALDQWEIAERTPLNEDETFMGYLRQLLREVDDLCATRS